MTTCADESHYMPTWIGQCCREWPMSYIPGPRGKCGLCGQRPTYVREGEPLHITHPRDERTA